MNIDSFTLQLIFVSIPGIICYFLCSKLIGKIGKTIFESILFIILFSIISYFAYNFWLLIFKIISGKEYTIDILERLFKIQSNTIEPLEVFHTSIIAILISFIFSYLYTYNILNRFATFIHASVRNGDEDVWHFFQRSKEIEGNWLYIRDHKLNLVYFGYISQWSESDKTRELVINEVSVYKDFGIESNNCGKDVVLLYNSDNLYISRNVDDISIEKNNYKPKEN